MLEIQAEIKGVKTHVEMSTVAAAIDDDQLALFGMKKSCSSLRKLLRVSVYVMKFQDNNLEQT